MGAGRASFTIPILAVIAFAATLAWFGYRYLRPESGVAPTTLTSPAAPAPPTPGAPPMPGTTPTAGEPPVRVVIPSGEDPARPGGGPGDRTTPAPSAVSPAAPGSIAVPGVAPAPLAASPTPPLTSAPALGPSESPVGPAFDVVRVEPSGESVIAGRAAPSATIVLLVDGQPHATGVADPAGQFALVPPPVPPGPHEILLEATAPDGSRTRSVQSVTVVIAPGRKEAPLVTVTKPGAPVVVLSRPDEPTRVATAEPGTPVGPGPGAHAPEARPAPAPAAPAPGSVAAAPPAERPAPGTPGLAPPRGSPAVGGPPGPAGTPRSGDPTSSPGAIGITSVEQEGSGRLFVSGQASPGATVRLYLSEAFLASATADATGGLAFSIERGIRPGTYRVRLDEVDPVTGAVRSRVEVPFTAPPASVASRDPAAGPRAAEPASAPAAPAQTGPQHAAASASPPGRSAGPAAVGSIPATTPAMRTPSPSAVGFGAVARTGPRPVVVPEVNTTVVARGDSLWEISRRAYGDGVRYTVIYGANALRIRDPNIIYPGQVFVVPGGRKPGTR